MHRILSRVFLRLVLCALTGLTGCASLTPFQPSPPVMAIPASEATALGALALRARVAAAAPTGQSGIHPMPQANVALDARLSLIRGARVSLDLQYYLIGDDDIGHLLLRELRDAAARGVRVRLLIDDFYTVGMDPLLLGLAAHPGVEVRLFNPFAGGRGSAAGRWLSMAFDFRRLNHRMHNKLFLADGALAVVGGRNMADGYFLRGSENFVDVDALLVGPVLTQLGAIFDRYWNSVQVRPIEQLVHQDEPVETLRQRFEALTQSSAGIGEMTMTKDVYGVPPLSRDPQAVMASLSWGEVEAFADSPDKVVRLANSTDLSETVTFRNLRSFREARSELMLFSPYFVPGRTGMEGLRQAREYKITVRVITNSMATTDEPLASLAYERYRVPMLRLGIELYEMRPMQLVADTRNGPGASRARLHAKLAMIDRKTAVMGSMNLDQRSATTNTELGLLVRNPRFVGEVLTFFNAVRQDDVRNAYQLKLKPDGQSLQWVALQGGGVQQALDTEPDEDPLLRFKLRLMSWFVSEDLL
jgi:putative cardiolipin synthase